MLVAAEVTRLISKPGIRNPNSPEPPTPKMGLEETLALTPAPRRPSPPRTGEARTVPRIFTHFGVTLLHGDSRRLLRERFKPPRLTILSSRPFCSPPSSFASVRP